MKIYKCDVCGAYFDPVVEPGCSTAESPLGAPHLAGVAMSGLDVCPRCAYVSKKVNFKFALLQAWREAVSENEKVPRQSGSSDEAV